MKISMLSRLCVLIFIFCFTNSMAQLYIPRNIQKAYDNETRSVDGKPGKNYWQNFGDYDLKIKFNPKSRLVEGTELITYYNNSPDTLKKIIIRNYPDFFEKGALRDWPIDAADESEGVSIEKIIINNLAVDVSKDNDKFFTEGTNMTARCLLPTKTASKIEIKWHYTLNKGSHVRTGQIDDGAFFIAYSFPRIAVYDDVDKWDNNEYLGLAESYFDFGNFTAEVSVPKSYAVWATGELQNAAEVFQQPIVQKMKDAFTSDAMKYVIDSTDLKNKTITVKNKWNTFKFKAAYVPDFAFAVSNHYLWQASSLVVDSLTNRKTIVNTVFNQQHKSYFDVHNDSRKTVEVMSQDFPGVPFPYPQITVVDGLDQMEYPMIINDNPLEDRQDNIELTDHEIFHTFFPFYMGTNQTKYAWMDEGWATIGEWYISPKIDTSITDPYGMDRMKANSGQEWDLPLIINSTETKKSYFMNAYAKPGLVYWYLKDMLGEEFFRKTIRQYMQNWNGKHPLPWDFFNSVNIASGQDLNWFWQKWFYEFGAIDLAIKEVTKKDLSYKVVIEMKGNKPVPVYMHVSFTDGTQKLFHHSAMVWKNGNKEFTVAVGENKAISKITLENLRVPDVNEKDNVYVPKD